MQHVWRWMILAAGFLVLVLGLAEAAAADAWFDVPLDHLNITQGKLPTPATQPANNEPRTPYVVLDGSGEAFAVVWTNTFARMAPAAPDHLVIHTTDPGDVSGRIFLSNGGSPGMTVLQFKVAAADAKADARKAFYSVMRDHYEQLLTDQIPGAAYFRRRVNEATAALGDGEKGDAPFTNRPASLDDTFSFFTGDEALSENLQLDRALPPGAAVQGGDMVPLDSITGITAAKIDWAPLIKDARITPDPLARDIPGDQAAIFFPDFASLVAVADEADRDGTPVLQYAETRSQDVGSRQWYERQLGLPLTDLTKRLGSQVVKSAAITSGDPYLRAGTDVAIVFEPTDAAALKQALSMQMRLLRFRHDVKSSTGTEHHLDYTAEVSADRTISSYMAVLKDGSIVVTNSLAQLAKFGAVQETPNSSVADQPEYTFFRNRYKLGDADESALLVITDAAIRRWCGPRERIADSRRVRAAAVLADLNARYLDKLVAGIDTPTLVATDYPVPDMGDIRLSNSGAASSTYGSLDFLTPISELKLDTVTRAEADAYGRWRDSYQNNWRGYFDPIAVRIGVHPHQLSADCTVRPLIANSDYADALSITTGAKLNAASRDPHDAVGIIGVAINLQSHPVQSAAGFAANMAPGFKTDPLGWLGSSVWLYADDDPFWKELAQAKDQDDFAEKNLGRLPVGLRLEVRNGLKLVAFLVSLHAFVDQTAPGTTIWDNLKYHDQAYVRISPSAQFKAQNADMPNLALYYCTTGDSLLITLSEPLLQRAIDRDLTRAAAKQAGKPSPDASVPPLLGDNAIVQANARAYDLLTDGTGAEFQKLMQERSWGNIPILNELHNQHPKEDPVTVYAKFFHATLIDPAGGQYTWNDQWQTMQSTIYGCPADPKNGPAGISALAGLLAGNFGLTFEDQGLRAKLVLDRN